MSRMHDLRESRPRSEDGQILVIFAFAIGIIVMMLALLFDGAHGLLLRRQMQDASDAAALAGVNLVQSFEPMGCSETEGPPPGEPREEVVQAVLDSLAMNLPDYDPNDVVVTCPDFGDNLSVKVELVDRSPNFFGSIFGADGLQVVSNSGAVNGIKPNNSYSIITTNPANLGHPQARNGCPSVLLSGGPTVKFDSAVYINSACLATEGGALSTNGNAATFEMADGVPIQIVGEYKPATLQITPEPWEHRPVRDDPLSGITPPAVDGPIRETSKLTLTGSSQSRVLQAGVYVGGIELKSSASISLEPGIYVMRGGGLKLGAGSSMFSIAEDAGLATVDDWSGKCAVDDCGILIYNTCSSATGSCPTNDTTMKKVDLNAQAKVKIRGYNPDVASVPSPNEEYRNLLFWQSKNPVPTAAYVQPQLELIGGGNVEMSGTVYAPSAKVLMSGSAGGGSGGTIELVLQFIAWDIEFSGNASFWFRYFAELWADPWGYGLYE
jgi:hypothetical protein